MKGIAILIMMFHHCYRSKDRFEKYIVDFWPFDMDLVVNVSDYLKICVSILRLLQDTAFIYRHGIGVWTPVPRNGGFMNGWLRH